MSDSASAIRAAEAALEKGDYSLCVKIIDPLLLSYSATTAIGTQLRLLKVTAYMGKGDEQKAIDICKTLTNNTSPTTRKHNTRTKVDQRHVSIDPQAPRQNWTNGMSPTSMPTYLPTDLPTYTNTRIHTHVRAYMHTGTHT